MKKEPTEIRGVRMREQSEDLFSIFSDVANSTGGTINTTQNPVAAFKNAAEATESYYLLYYSPEKYVKNGKFKNIDISVKGKKYKILHRSGYFAN
jgi:hypothetical protein